MVKHFEGKPLITIIKNFYKQILPCNLYIEYTDYITVFR